jgi:hypothetical protein
MTLSSAEDAERRYTETRRTWKLRNSTWLLWGILSAGLFTGVGFAIIARHARWRRWWFAAAGWSIVGALIMTLVSLTDSSKPQPPVVETLKTVAILVALAGIGHTIWENGRWLRWAAQNPRGRNLSPPRVLPPPRSNSTSVRPPSISESTTAAAPPTTAPIPEHQDKSARLGLDRSDFFADRQSAVIQPSLPPLQPSQSRPPASLQPLDVNAADATQLATLPGFTIARANAALELRPTAGFPSVDAFAGAARLAPHEFARVRHLLRCSPPVPPAPHTTGRVLDY